MPDASVATEAEGSGFAESPLAHARTEELRSVFVVRPPPHTDHLVRRLGSAATASRAVIGPAIASRLERTRDGLARPVFASTPVAPALAPASLGLALRASGDVVLEDERSHIALKFRLRGASDVPLAASGGLALYPGALGGADVLHRPRPDGTEDFVVFETRPDREELVYDVDVSRAEGLRLVGNTLELLDASGTPRLRMSPPYAVDARGARHWATVTVDDCAYDTDPAGPWGRPVTAPGATSCGVHVSWSSEVYPAIVDPLWTTTGSMTMARVGSDMTLLASGKVLVTGGCFGCQNAELFDGTSTFAATGSMVASRDVYAVTKLASGKVLFTGGYPASGTALTSAEVFDGVSTFTATGSMKYGRAAHTATLLPSGKVLIAGGETDYNVYVSVAELYNGTTSFATTGSIVQKRTGHTATLLPSGKVLLAGGSIVLNAYMTSAELFDGTSAFAATGSMNAGREGAYAVLLPTGKVLIAGGTYSGTFAGAEQVELFDGTSAFSLTGSLNVARMYFGAALLPSGKVLVAGGETGAASETSSAELFDGTSTFANTTGMTTARRLPTAVLLASGKVLVAGGQQGSSFIITDLSSAEIYGPIAAGGACTLANECASGACDDGICCSGPCNGSCQTCTPGTGACVAVKSADDADTCTGASSCDASGACKLKNGQPSGSGAACVSGFSADGVCCNVACSGACDACSTAAGAASDGTCAAVAQGSVGNPACGSGYVCDGVSAACVIPCVGDVDCASGYYCAADGTCKTQRTQGQTCNVAAGADCKVDGCRACATGNCVDGVCCDTACTTVCYACAAALKAAGPDGICGAVAFHKPSPRVSCPAGGAGPCGPDGMCDGAGKCADFAPTGTSCGSSACNGNDVTGSTCDGKGACVSGSTVNCSPYTCAGGSCTSSCGAGAACGSGYYCSQGGSCVPKGGQGAQCTAASECASGFCVDGYCCDGGCTGQCEACNVTGSEGTCSAITGAPKGGRSACAAAGTPCAGACDGSNRVTCTYPDGTACGRTCAAGRETEKRCTASGACMPGPAAACPGNIVTCDGDACKASCTADSDCAQGMGCATGKCLPLATSTCDGAHTVKAPNGTETDCSPYNCEGDHCKLGCGSINDCAPGNVCDNSGLCVALSANASTPTGSSGGCGHAPSAPPSSGRAPAALALAIGALMRRRRSGGHCSRRE